MEEEEKKRLEDEAEEKGIGVECGCCYCDAPIQHMCQCAEGHLFCLSCLKRCDGRDKLAAQLWPPAHNTPVPCPVAAATHRNRCSARASTS